MTNYLKLQRDIYVGEGNSSPNINETLEDKFKDDNFINNVCLSYKHDYGLLSLEEKEKIKFECKEWLRAILNNY